MTEASGIHRALKAIPKFSGTDFRTWDDKIRAGVSLYAVEILELLDGATCPATTDTNGGCHMASEQRTPVLSSFPRHRRLGVHNRKEV